MKNERALPPSLMELAKESGFSAVAALDVGTLEFLPAVREMCAEGKCRSYGKNWACPPACGSLEEIREKVHRYSQGLLLQTVGDREDPFDFEAIQQVERDNKSNFERLVNKLKEAKVDFYAMSAGTCTKCAECTYPRSPCRHPEELFPSMEACGLLVSSVCRNHGLPYYYGEQKIAFTCLVLFDRWP